MKTVLKYIILTGLLICLLPSNAMPPPGSPSLGTHITRGNCYQNLGRTAPQGHAINNIEISDPPTKNYYRVPPPPPPRRALYRYSDFGGNRRFPRRSYYIPSYCMPERNFVNNFNNPFCSQYRPYGSNMYINF